MKRLEKFEEKSLITQVFISLSCLGSFILPNLIWIFVVKTLLDLNFFQKIIFGIIAICNSFGFMIIYTGFIDKFFERRNNGRSKEKR